LKLVLTLSLKGYLPFRLYDYVSRHWLWKHAIGPLWADKPVWIGRVVELGNGMRIEVDPRDVVGRKIMQAGYFEPETVRFIERYVKPGMTVLDIGAHVGQYSLLASGLVGPSGAVHAFEPHPLLYRVLCGNLDRNRCSNVLRNNLAVSSEDGTGLLFASKHENFGMTSLRPPEALYSGVQVPVKTISLDGYIRRHSIGRIDLIKLDVEGAELPVLQGATDLLAGSPDLLLVVEFCGYTTRRFGHTVAELASFLRNSGLHLFSVTSEGLRPYTPINEIDYVNVVATRRSLTAVQRCLRGMATNPGGTLASGARPADWMERR
jgi:FkbM family methyltransferase